MNDNELIWSETLPDKPGWYWADALHAREPQVVRVRSLPSGRLTIEQVTLDASQTLFFALEQFKRWAGPIEPPVSPALPGQKQETPS